MTDPSTRPRVRAVVLNWNGGEFVVRCVEHLTRTDWPADRLEIVVLDNASTDGSDRVIADRFGDRVRLVPTGDNLGFVANNLAMRDLGDVDHVALVNNDAFVEPGWLAPLVDALESDPELGAACPKILFAPSFVELAVSAPTFQPPGDGRQLGVRVREVATFGESVFGLAQFVSGSWGTEHEPDGRPFRWLGGDAVIRVPVPADGRGSNFGFIDVELCAEADKEVVLACGRYRSHVRVGPDWRRFRIPHHTEPFDVVNNAGSVVLTDGFGADRGFLQIDDGRFDEPVEVFNWCGGGVLLRRQYLEHVGLFDERFFLYYEDTDLAWRGQAKGWRYRYVPTSVLRHLHAASSGEGSDTFQFYVERNRLFVLTKNAPAELAIRAVLGFVTATASYARRDVLPPLLHRRRPPLRHIRNRVRSFASYKLHLPGMLASRRELQGNRTVGDDELSRRWLPRAAWTAAERDVVDGAGATVWAVGSVPGDPTEGPTDGHGPDRRTSTVGVGNA